MKIQLIGHNTLLIVLAGMKILTDPYFGAWGNLAYTRLAPPARPREQLSDADLILVSHTHWDHVDAGYFHLLSDQTPVLCPQVVRWQVRMLGGKRVIGMKSWEQQNFGEITVTAVPAVHIVPTIGFVLRGEGHCIYFAGDTYYASFFKDIAHRLKPDIALIPVTTFRIPMTMGEDESLRATRELDPSLIIPIHLGVQPRSPLLRTGHTPERFIQKLRAAGIQTRVVLLKEGETYQE
jgi:L-ascorbate metabolism protein UlaG (beta-lactamase superfamily)